MKTVIATLILTALVICMPVLCHAQTATLTGFVTDRETGTPLAGVTIMIEGTRLGAISNKQGRFTIKDAPRGMVNVRGSMIGYEPVIVPVFVKGGQGDVVMTMLQSSLRTNEVVVSAGRRVQAAQDVPISVAIMDQQDLATRSVTQLDEALRYVSGVSLQGDQVNIRGSSGFAFGLGSRTMVMLDGFPLLSGDNGDIKFDVMPVADVERIEVIKGAGSALYGTGALGGVVSMFTKSPSPVLSVQGRAYGGYYTPLRNESWKFRSTMPFQWGADIRMAQQIDDVSFNVSGGYRSDEGYRQFDRQQRGFAYGKFSWSPDPTDRLSVFSLLAGSVRQNFVYWVDLPRATFPDDIQDQDQLLATQKIAVAAEWLHLFSNVTSLIIRPGVRTHFENTVNGESLDSNTSTALAYNADVVLTSSMAEWFTTTIGVTGRLNHVSSDVYGQQLQSIVSGFGQAEITLPVNAILTVGLRVDREETQTLSPQIELSPKLGISWRASPDLTFRGSVGRGFRAATIAERYANIRYGPFQTRSNPDIMPESSWSGEIGAHLTSTQWILPVDVDLAVFDNELFDLIEPSFDFNDPNVPIVFSNLTRARILGAELTIRAALSRSLKIETGITVMLPRDLSNDEVLKYRNNVLWYSRGLWDLELGSVPLQLQAEYRFVSRIENVDERLDVFIVDASQRVPSHVVDLRIFVDLAPISSYPIRLGLIGKNVLDYYYNEYVANLSPTRSILLQVEWR
jgi:outer membrane receptor for ferrienterochelin and colicins